MGLEKSCLARVNGREAHVTALLETDEILVHGDARARIPFTEIRAVASENGVLSIEHAAGDLELELGPAADKWADKIRNPKSRIDKLGVAQGQRISVITVHDESFKDELVARGAEVSTRLVKNSALIFYGIEHIDDLDRLPSLRDALPAAGALWIIFPKGRKDLKDSEIISRARAVKLQDVKVARFSETHTALRFIPARKE